MKARTPASSLAASWKGVRMRTLRAGADPDAEPRLVTLPADWEDSAASALAQLLPGTAGITLARAAADWILPLAEDARAAPDLAPRLARLLLYRAAAPNRAIWQRAGHDAPAFIVNLAAFGEPGFGFDLDGFISCIGTVREALLLFGAASSRILLGNLDACLAGLGLEYDSEPARDVAACLAALATGLAHPDRAAQHGAGRQPPARCAIPGLAARARLVWQDATRARDGATELFPEAAAIETGLSAPGPADALLGFEACGIAPIFSPLRADGRLAASTLARLAARGMSPEAALAASLAGDRVLFEAGFEATQAMQRAVSPFIDRLPRVTADGRYAAAQPPVRRELPSRHGGFTQKAAIGGNRLFLRTGEYADGSLGELSITAVRDNPAHRGLMDAFSQAVSIGLQHGVPLAAYVEAFAYTRFGAAGAVEGDTAVSSATSVLDYAFRSLAQAYLGRSLPDAPQEHAAQHPTAADSEEALLPLDLPRASNIGTRPAIRQRHGLRLVG